jgi:hypothetical protein
MHGMDKFRLYVALLIYFPFKRIFCLRRTKISWCNEFFAQLIWFCIKIFTISHLFNLLQTYSDEVMLYKFVKIHLQGCFQYGSEVQISNSVLIHGNVWEEITSHSVLSSVYHTCISHGMMHHHDLCMVYVAKHHGFDGMHRECHCFTVISMIWSILCAKFMYFLVFISNFICLYSSCPVELSINYWTHD